jgi:hypothetical protein
VKEARVQPCEVIVGNERDLEIEAITTAVSQGSAYSSPNSTFRDRPRTDAPGDPDRATLPDALPRSAPPGSSCSR